MQLGKTIQIFLPDGNPRSIKIAEITDRTIQAILIPRAKLEYAAERHELKNVGIYFLVGKSDEESKPILYIGESDDCLVRLKQHNRQKDFWDVAIVIISKTQFFTKTHIKFLESFCHEEAKRIARFKIENSSVPNKPFISEPMKADLMDNYGTIKVLVGTFGYPFFDEIKKPKKQDLLFCRGNSAEATGEYTEDGLVVFKGSICKLEEVPSAVDYLKKVRDPLIKDGILIEKNSSYEFTEDHIFNSPSAAATVVLGTRVNGWTYWKYEDGKTLDEVKRQSGENT